MNKENRLKILKGMLSMLASHSSHYMCNAYALVMRIHPELDSGLSMTEMFPNIGNFAIKHGAYEDAVLKGIHKAWWEFTNVDPRIETIEELIKCIQDE